MATLIKEIPVYGKQQAFDIISVLSSKYQLRPTDPDNALDVSNEDVNVYYNADSASVRMESIHGTRNEEYIRELLAEFPVFF
jgi:hypothetical protein